MTQLCYAFSRRVNRLKREVIFGSLEDKGSVWSEWLAFLKQVGMVWQPDKLRKVLKEKRRDGS
jgi:hypothetical protein